MLTSTLLEMDFLISYWLILVFILEAFKHPPPKEIYFMKNKHQGMKDTTKKEFNERPGRPKMPVKILILLFILIVISL